MYDFVNLTVIVNKQTIRYDTKCNTNEELKSVSFVISLGTCFWNDGKYTFRSHRTRWNFSMYNSLWCAVGSGWGLGGNLGAHQGSSRQIACSLFTQGNCHASVNPRSVNGSQNRQGNRYFTRGGVNGLTPSYPQSGILFLHQSTGRLSATGSPNGHGEHVQKPVKYINEQ